MKYSLKYLRDLTEKLFKNNCPCPEIDVKEVLVDGLKRKIKKEAEERLDQDVTK